MPMKLNPMALDSSKSDQYENDKPQSTGLSSQALEYKKVIARPTSSTEGQLEIQSAPIKLIAGPNFYQPKQSAMKTAGKKQIVAIPKHK